MGSFEDKGNADDTDDVGNMGDSDDEGSKADIHNEVAILREVLELSNKPIGNDADNLDNVKGENFLRTEGNADVQLLGAPDG